MNRAPSQQDPWWPDHQRTCGGTYKKVREPEEYCKKKQKKSEDGPKKTVKDSQTKGMPKIYDLWKKENDKADRISSGKTSTIAKGNDSHSMNRTTGMNKFWKVENEDGSSSGKENDVQKINSAFKPFSGKGNVLGSKGDSLGNSVEKSRTTIDLPKHRNIPDSEITNNNLKTPLLPGTKRSTAISIDVHENDFVQDVNFATGESSEKVLPTSLQFLNQDTKSINFGSVVGTVSKSEKQKDHFGSQLTIVDSFKKVGEKKVPVVVIPETLPNPALRTTIRTFVQCPVCHDEIEESKINTHLDVCL